MQRTFHRRPSMTRKSGMAAMVSMLWGCHPKMLPTFTAASLAAQFNVTVDKAARMLAAAREARG